MAVADTVHMRQALRLARKALGNTSPNPVVGAVLVKAGKIIGRGWHRRAGLPHAEIEALNDAAKRGKNPRHATLYVTLEPCCTHGRTPPCTEAIIAAGIRRVVVAATDPNPHHAGRGFELLRAAGIRVEHGLLAAEADEQNEAFNHWIVHRTPFVTVKAAMTLDGKIATASGESKWITGEAARLEGMKLRGGSDAILVGINTVLADNPSLTYRPLKGAAAGTHKLRRFVLDSRARTPLTASVVADEYAGLTTIIVSASAPERRVAALARRVNVWTAPLDGRRIDIGWVLRKLGDENITSLLVEGGGEVNATFLLGGFAQRAAFFYAPKVLGGKNARKAVGGAGAESLADALQLEQIRWRSVGEDLFLTARVRTGPGGG